MDTQEKMKVLSVRRLFKEVGDSPSRGQFLSSIDELIAALDDLCVNYPKYSIINIDTLLIERDKAERLLMDENIEVFCKMKTETVNRFYSNILPFMLSTNQWNM